MNASQYRSSSSLSSDSVGSIMRQPLTGKDIVGAWKPTNMELYLEMPKCTQSLFSEFGPAFVELF